MSEDLGNQSWASQGPEGDDPLLIVAENAVSSSLMIGGAVVGAPALAIGQPEPRSLTLENHPFFSYPELTQVPGLPPEISGNRFLGSKLIYRQAEGLEKAMADVDSERITLINAELIKDIWDPWACPARLLPYLAWAMGVEYWNDKWSEVTKRSWIAYQLTFKSIRGTQEALERVVDYAGRDVSRWGHQVKKVTTRPQKVFSGPSLTREEREEWLKKLPQVRVWRVNEVGTSSRSKSFYGSSSSIKLHSPQFCLGGGFPVPSTAIYRLRRRVRWIENDQEIDVTIDDFGSFFQIHKPSIEDGSVFSGRPFGLGRHYIPSTAHERLITIEPKPLLPWRSANTPSLQAVTSEPERVTVSGLRQASVFSDLPMRQGFFVPSTAHFRIFQRYAVLDESVRELRRRPVQFMGTGRYGFPAFTAWAEVAIGNTRNRRAADFGVNIPKYRFYLPHDDSAVRRVEQAIVASKALRDKIMLQTGPELRFVASRKPVLAGIDVMPAGSGFQ